MIEITKRITNNKSWFDLLFNHLQPLLFFTVIHSKKTTHSTRFLLFGTSHKRINATIC